MRGVGGASAAMLVVAIVVLAGVVSLYAASQAHAPQPTTSPVLSNSQTNTVGTTLSAAMSTAIAVPSGTIQVVIADGSGENDDGDTQFAPPVITVVIGVNNTVTWINQDEIVHSVLTANGFSSGDIAPGHTYSYTFMRAGVYPYYCGYYPIMTGVITVKNP